MQPPLAAVARSAWNAPLTAEMEDWSAASRDEEIRRV
jgi:hypothetical protein